MEKLPYASATVAIDCIFNAARYIVLYVLLQMIDPAKSCRAKLRYIMNLRMAVRVIVIL